MRSRIRSAPNFRAKYINPCDYPAREAVGLFSAEDEAALRELLETRFSVDVVKIQKYDFAKWLKRARDADKSVSDALARGEKPVFHEALWSELKGFLVQLFDGKCAYCETNVEAGFTADVEHYRPKRRLTPLDDDSPERVEECEKHGGYTWLAHEYENYLPVCRLCNSGRGKLCRFPIAAGKKYATSKAEFPRTSDLDHYECPLLLNPFCVEPLEHISFVTSVESEPEGRDEWGRMTGTAFGLTEQGHASVRIYNLNRLQLINARAQVQRQVRSRLEECRIGNVNATLLNISKGDGPYTAAAYAEACMWLKRLDRELAREAGSVMKRMSEIRASAADARKVFEVQLTHH